jgi:hypothetical protein
VQPHAALAERLLERLVRPGDEAVEGYGDVAEQPRHRSAIDVPVSSSVFGSLRMTCLTVSVMVLILPPSFGDTT